MDNKTYREAYEQAAGELEALLQEQGRIEDRILALRKTMNSLATLISQHEGKDKNFAEYANAHMRELIDSTITDDIRRIVAASDQPFTTADIRDELNKLGGSLAEHSNPLATINAILNRLIEQGFVTETVKGGRKAWKRSNHPINQLKIRRSIPGASGNIRNWMALHEPPRGKK
jgi:hypothetical protein